MYSAEQRPMILPPLQLWRIPLSAEDQDQARLYRLLSESERHRAEHFRQPADRRRFVLSHAALRLIVSRMIGIAADALPLSASPQGKPFLNTPHAAVQFNLSHSRDMALLAVMPHTSVQVGVDIEWQRPLRDHRGDDLAGMIKQVCTVDETHLIEASTHPEQHFYQCWVAKEAVLKCIGTGLHRPMPGFSVLSALGSCNAHEQWFDLSLPEESQDSVLASLSGVGLPVSLRPLQDMPEGYSAAVAVGAHVAAAGPALPIQLHDWVF